MTRPIGPDGLPMEMHHTDFSGQGPGNLLVSRTEHIAIHQANADALRELGIPTRGFCGDSFTLKPGK